MSDSMLLKDLEKRIDKLEHIFDTINSLTIQIERLAIETKYMREEQTKLSERVDTIERKPEKRHEAVITTAITTVVGAIVGAIIALVLK